MANSYTYILLCCDSSYYVGSTKDVGRRFWQQANTKSDEFTSERLPLK
ncbi:GIY-YIG nuclease family protein [Aequorivita marina]